MLDPLPGPQPLTLRALARVASGEEASAREILDRLAVSEARPFYPGLILAALGEDAAAFRQFRQVDRWVALSTTPAFRYFFPEVLGRLRRDPRYASVLRDLNRHWGLEPDGDLPATEGPEATPR